MASGRERCCIARPVGSASAWRASAAGSGPGDCDPFSVAFLKKRGADHLTPVCALPDIDARQCYATLDA